MTGGEAAGLYAGCADDVTGYPDWLRGVEDRGAGMLFFRPLPADTGEPDGSIDIRSMRSFRRCCS